MKTANPNYLRKGSSANWGNHFGRVEREKRGAVPVSGSMAEVEQVVTNLLRELETKSPK